MCRNHYRVSEGKNRSADPHDPIPDRIEEKIERRPAAVGETFALRRALEIWWEPTGAVCLTCRDSHLQARVDECFQPIMSILAPEPPDPDLATVAALLLLRQSALHSKMPQYQEGDALEVIRRTAGLEDRIRAMGPARFGRALAALSRQGVGDVRNTSWLKTGRRRRGVYGWPLGLKWAISDDGQWLRAEKIRSGSAGRAETHSTWVERWRTVEGPEQAEWGELCATFSYHLRGHWTESRYVG